MKEIPANVLLTQAQGLRAAIKARAKFYVTSALERMERTISTSILANKKDVDATMLKHIADDVDAASAIDPINAATVSELLKKYRSGQKINPNAP